MTTVGMVTGSTTQQTTVASQKTLGKDEFLKLLITQLKQQDPLSPVQNTEFIAQMAQLTSLEQLQELNKNVNQLVELQEQNKGRQDLLYAASLLGREVEARNPETNETYRDLVKGYYQKDGEIWLSCAEHEIPLDWVYRATVSGGQGGV